jgi:hypothetical protein
MSDWNKSSALSYMDRKNEAEVKSYRFVPLSLDFFFGDGPGGFGVKSSTSERFKSVLPPMDSVVKRPFLTRLEIAWRVTLRRLAASTCETQCEGSNFFFEEFL